MKVKTVSPCDVSIAINNFLSVENTEILASHFRRLMSCAVNLSTFCYFNYGDRTEISYLH